jgi:hypothetical protein
MQGKDSTFGKEWQETNWTVKDYVKECIQMIP